MNSCECCFTDFLAKCETEIVINTNLTPGNTYRWVISDKFGHLYEGTAIAEDDGSLIIPIEDVPAGIFTQYSSDFNLQIYSENSCSPIKFKLTGEYDCVTFNIHGGTFVKNTIGCETTFELAEGGGAMVMGAVGAGDAEGGVITGNELSLHKATETQPGLVSVDGTPQIFGGPKSFSGTVQLQNQTAFESNLKIKEIAAPAAPPTGYGYLYAKTDGKPYWKDDAGVEYDLSIGATPGIDSVLAVGQALTADRALNINGHTYEYEGGNFYIDIGANFLHYIQNGDNNYMGYFSAHNSLIRASFQPVVGDINAASVEVTADEEEGMMVLRAIFNQGASEAKIEAIARDGDTTLVYDAMAHTFNGNFESGTDNAWELGENFLDITVDGEPFFEIDPASGLVSIGPFIEQGTESFESKLTLTPDVGAELKYIYTNSIGAIEKEAKIVGFADATTATLTHTGDVIIADLAGGGTTGLSIDNAGKIIRTP